MSWAARIHLFGHRIGLVLAAPLVLAGVVCAIIAIYQAAMFEPSAELLAAVERQGWLTSRQVELLREADRRGLIEAKILPATIDQFRKKYPEYNDLSNRELADKLYAKFYSKVNRYEFDRQVERAPRDLFAERGIAPPTGKANGLLEALDRLEAEESSDASIPDYGELLYGKEGSAGGNPFEAELARRRDRDAPSQATTAQGGAPDYAELLYGPAPTAAEPTSSNSSAGDISVTLPNNIATLKFPPGTPREVIELAAVEFMLREGPEIDAKGVWREVEATVTLAALFAGLAVVLYALCRSLAWVGAALFE